MSADTLVYFGSFRLHAYNVGGERDFAGLQRAEGFLKPAENLNLEIGAIVAVRHVRRLC